MTEQSSSPPRPSKHETTSATLHSGRKRSRSRSREPARDIEIPTQKKRRSSPDPTGSSETQPRRNDASQREANQGRRERSYDDKDDRRGAENAYRNRRRERDDGRQRPAKRGREMPAAFGRRDYDRPRDHGQKRQGDRFSPPFRRSQSPRNRSRSPRRRSPSPIRASPPPEGGRVRKRAGGGARVNTSQIEAVRRRQEERERETQQIISSRGVQDASNQFYNARPEWVKERGRDWRRNESKIKGLRSFNNWIKSVIIQKFAPNEPPVQDERGWGQEEPEAVAGEDQKPLLVLDLGCGKGGDLGKWQQAPQTVALYVGLDPADQSVSQARDRYNGMRRGRRPIYDARFVIQDCFGEWIGDVPIIDEVGIDPNVGPDGNMMSARWGKSGGFDVVTMMFTMHYSFENEQKARMMLRNVAGCLKKGGRLIGVCPNSDIISSKVAEWHRKRKEDQQKSAGTNGEEITTDNPDPQPEEGEVEDEDSEEALAPSPSWGNRIYRVRFNGVTPPDGVFRPATGWKYTYWMDEAVDVPEYVVPWEAFRALAEDYNLEQRYRKPFLEIWESDKDDATLGPLAVRMGVTKSEGGEVLLSEDEREAVGLYHAFCFTKV